MRHDIDIERSWRQLHHLTAVNAVPSSWKAEKLGPETSMLLSSRRGYEERSVTVEQQSNRFLSVSRRIEMNEAITGATFPTWGEIYQKMLVDTLPPVSATLRQAELAASTVPLRVGGRVEPVASKKIRWKSGGTENYMRMTEAITGAGGDGVEVKTNKNAHYFQKETVSKRDNNLSLFFLISQHALKCEKFSPLGEMSASWRTEGYRLVANKKKSSAYET